MSDDDDFRRLARENRRLAGPSPLKAGVRRQPESPEERLATDRAHAKQMITVLAEMKLKEPSGGIVERYERYVESFLKASKLDWNLDVVGEAPGKEVIVIE